MEVASRCGIVWNMTKRQKQARVTFYVPESVREDLDHLAADKSELVGVRVSWSSIARLAIRKGIEQLRAESAG